MVGLIIILIIILICFLSVKRMSKKTGFRANYIFQSLLYIFIIGMVVMPFVFAIFPNLLKSDKVEKADGFKISSYIVSLNVNEDNVVNVKENIAIDFTNGNKHGIYKYTPEWYEYTSSKGDFVKRKSIINNLKSPTDSYTVDAVNKKKRIKLGSAYSYVGVGIHDYEIDYDYNMGEDPFNGYDEFIFHLYGDFWGTDINNPMVVINMPKSFDKDKVKFYADKTLKEDITKYMEMNVEGNSIEALYNIDKCREEKSNCNIDKSITVSINLPDGYFENCSNNYSNINIGLVVIVLIITFIVLIFWIVFGKNHKKKITIVEYYPPFNFDAARVGYILNKATGKKMTIALIIELAAKGYIQIFDYEKETYIVNLCPKDGKFKEKETYKSKVPEDISFAKQSNLKPLSDVEKIVYDNLFSSGNINKLSKDTSFYKTFAEVYDVLEKGLKNEISDKKSRGIQILSIILSIISVIISLVSFFIIPNLSPKFYNLYYVSFILTAFTLLLTALMGRKTDYAEEVSAKIRGFKDYLLTVEKDKLETLVEENPNYFYEILPYTYILNISRKWIKKFENIPLPQTNMGNFDYTDMNSLSRVADSISFPVQTYSSSGSSGCSSCGGGCSSCGGGCSSCGGGGSW